MLRFAARFFRDQSGATAIEYGLIIAGLATVIVAALGSVGGTLKGIVTSVNTNVSG